MNLNFEPCKYRLTESFSKVQTFARFLLACTCMAFFVSSWKIGETLTATMAFIPNPQGKRTINHKDGNKQNNNVENLEWATDSENVSHAFANGLKQPVNGGSHGRAILTKEIVIEIKSLLSKKVKQHQIAEMFGVSIGAISRIKTGKNWKHL